MKLISIISICLLLSFYSLYCQTDPPCTAYQSHDFDYMLGEWQIKINDTSTAYSVFKKEFGNCIMKENYKEPVKNYLRTSEASYNPIKQKWELVTYDNKGEYYIFTGVKKGKNIELEADKILPNGKKIFLQLIYSNILENSFVREIKVALDSNKVFRTFDKANYIRMKTSEINGKKIYKEILVNASAPEIYERWTQKSGILKFMGEDCYIIMEPGGPYEIYFDMKQPLGFRGSEGCTVLSFIENKMLSFTWNAPPQFANVRNADAKAWVVVELEKIDDTHTKVKLTHTGWRDGEEWNQVYAYFDKAWTKVLEWLRDSY